MSIYREKSVNITSYQESRARKVQENMHRKDGARHSLQAQGICLCPGHIWNSHASSPLHMRREGAIGRKRAFQLLFQQHKLERLFSFLQILEKDSKNWKVSTPYAKHCRNFFFLYLSVMSSDLTRHRGIFVKTTFTTHVGQECMQFKSPIGAHQQV